MRSSTFVARAVALVAAVATALVIAPSAVRADTVAEGKWVNKGYDVAGKWSVQEEEGKLLLKLDGDFATRSGPDLKLFLTPHAVDSVTGSNATKEALLVAPLKSTKGAATYAIPPGTDLSKYKSVVILCEKFSKLWSAGRLAGQ